MYRRDGRRDGGGGKERWWRGEGEIENGDRRDGEGQEKWRRGTRDYGWRQKR